MVIAFKILPVASVLLTHLIADAGSNPLFFPAKTNIIENLFTIIFSEVSVVIFMASYHYKI